jgi:hypothetical protein
VEFPSVEEPDEGLVRVLLPEGAERVDVDVRWTEYRALSAPDTVIADVGRCIYCGTTEDLGIEHAVPLGLQGSWLLLNASCRACANTTSLFERSLLRHSWLAARHALGIRTRHRDRPRTTTVRVHWQGNTQEVELPSSEAPAQLVLPVFPEPDLHGHRAAGRLAITGFWRMAIGPRSHVAVADAFGADEAWTRTTIDAFAFARFVAKVAWCFAVAQWGLDALSESPLPGLIVADASEIGRWVGGDTGTSDRIEGLHMVETLIDSGRREVNVHLFARLGAPVYRVVITV